MSAYDLVLRGEQAMLEKRFADALPDLRAALDGELDADAYPSERGEYIPLPQRSLCESLYGLALFEVGERDAAMAHLDRAIELDRDDKRAVANRGHVRRERGELPAAIEDLTRALERSPDYAFARFRRAQCYASLGRLADAERDLDVILAANPLDAAPAALRCDVRRQQGKSDQREPSST